MRKVALSISAAIVIAQWLVVGGFIARSYTWWMKANDFQVTAGVSGTIAMAVFAAAAIAYSAYFYVTTQQSATSVRVISLLVLCTGLIGQLVFWGMVLSGVTILVHRQA